jgi:hypothetical protein
MMFHFYILEGTVIINTLKNPTGSKSSQCLDSLSYLRILRILKMVYEYKSKSKAIPVTGRGGLQGCEMLRIPHSLENLLTDGGKVVSQHIGRVLLP